MASLISFLTVLVVAVGIASIVSALYATALRLWESGQVDSSGNAHLIARTGSVLCFSLCVAVVLFTLWLIVPQFH
ncbi:MULTISPECIES: hypothetical protein [unclassified Pseudoclavibacter]|uniref:hypothetical protein n=1 Tax=unclassified Pseudoclavibacter TaxID=2615177 RepID=UPI0013012832|nr:MULTISPECIES: hypothetical protein [unclassified Pseudoclavibacter]KAB1658973.1 hypothetical protein F8O09_05240 [Pseudoclavibacter sp. CFCC 11306]KAB1660993.1 hypothetical protein F8O07_03265 [Pseudoclavibacter sp. CFCC 13796]